MYIINMCISYHAVHQLQEAHGPISQHMPDVHPKKGAAFRGGCHGNRFPLSGKDYRGFSMVSAPKVDAPAPCMEYLPAFTINLSQMLVKYTRNVDPFGKIDAQTCSLAMDLFKGLSCFGMQSFDG